MISSRKKAMDIAHHEENRRGSGDFATENQERRPSVQNQCVTACRDAAMKYKRPSVNAIRDFPEGCGQFVAPVLEYSVQSEISHLLPLEIKYSIGKNGEQNPMRKGSLRVLEKECINSSKDSEHGTNQLPKRALTKALPKAYLNRKTISAIPCLSRGCTKLLVSKKKDSLKAKAMTAARINRLNHKNSNAEHKYIEEPSRRGANQKNVISNFKISKAIVHGAKGKCDLNNSTRQWYYGKNGEKKYCS